MSANQLDNLASYCTDRVDDKGIPESERRLWQQIASEISAYLEPASDALTGHPELFA
jgi:hypothetical protein